VALKEVVRLVNFKRIQQQNEKRDCDVIPVGVVSRTVHGDKLEVRLLLMISNYSGVSCFASAFWQFTKPTISEFLSSLPEIVKNFLNHIVMIINYKGKGKVVPVLNELSTTP
jgi:hypothetical protein